MSIVISVDLGDAIGSDQSFIGLSLFQYPIGFMH